MSALGSNSAVAGAVPQGATGPPAGAPPHSANPAPQTGWLRRFVADLDVSHWRRVPLPFIVLALWGIARWAGYDWPIGSVWSVGLIATCFIILMLEFFKSGDVALGSFKLDQLLSVVATVIVVAAETLLWEHKGVSTVDFFVLAVILGDAYVSPVNSFRTAQRNIQAGVNTGGGDPRE